MMKIFFTSVLAFLILSVNAQISIPNAGFESWVTGNFFIAEFPAGWKASDVFPGITKVTDAHNGSYAMKLSVAKYSTGVGGDDIYYAFSTPSSTVAPLYYTFWAKVHLSGTDKFNMDADLTNRGSTLLVSEIPYGRNQITSSGNTAVWQQFSFAMQSSPATAYDSVSLRFRFYPQLDTASNVIIDDLAFSNYPAGISDVAGGAAIESIYPNPGQGVQTITYTLDAATDVTLEIYDLLGQRSASVLTARQSAGKYRTSVDISSYADGVYYARLTADGKSATQKIIVQH